MFVHQRFRCNTIRDFWKEKGQTLGRTSIGATACDWLVSMSGHRGAGGLSLLQRRFYDHIIILMHRFFRFLAGNHTRLFRQTNKFTNTGNRKNKCKNQSVQVSIYNLKLFQPQIFQHRKRERTSQKREKRQKKVRFQINEVLIGV